MTGSWDHDGPSNAGPETTLPSEQRDFPEWHRGRPRYAVWAIEIDDAALEHRLAEVRAALQPMLLPGYARQPHITVHLCGFPVAAPESRDELGADHLQAHLDALTRQRIPTFELQVGGAFGFVSAACLAVHDESNVLKTLRQILQQAAPNRDSTPYVPHVTAGLYASAWPLRDVHARLQALRLLPKIHLPVKALAWMVYDSARIAGPLRALLRYELADGRCAQCAESALGRASRIEQGAPSPKLHTSR